MKCKPYRCLKLLLFAAGVLLTSAVIVPRVSAAESRHHEAHEHGAARMNVALEGNDLYIEFTSPAANIVGFEHHPSTEKQKASVKKAIETLKSGAALFILSPGAEGRLAKSMVHTDIESDSDQESEHVHTQEQGDINKGAEEQKHQENHEAEEHERHSDFKAEYHFFCKKSEKLAQIEVMLFRLFPGIEHIEVQLLTAGKQTAVELTAKKNRINM
jgi:hypothetical protein